MPNFVDDAGPSVVAPRWARAAVVTLVGLGVALACHGVAGGEVPPVGGLVLMALGGLVVTFAAAGREWSVGALVVALVGAQVVVHAAAAGPAWLGGGTDGMGGMEMTGPTHGVGPGMLLAHLVATVATAALLRRGDVGLAGLLRGVRRRCALLLRPVAAPVPRPTGRRVVGELRVPSGRVWAADVAVRGPPGRALRPAPA